MRLLTTLLLVCASVAHGQVVISEVADKGSSGTCDGNDWLELHNAGTEAVDLEGYILHDDNGATDESAYTFPSTLLSPNDYLLLCTEAQGGPQFRIGGDDTITLVSPTNEVVSSVELPDTDSAVDVTYALDSTDGSYIYTTTPTPGAANTLTPIVQETSDDIKQRLSEQNAQGTQFFGIDNRGFPVADAYDDVLDLYITMETADYDYLLKNQSFEVYRPFTSARVVTKEGEELISISSPGRIRPKGQSTLYFATCFGSPTIPFQLEFNNINETQTLFGVEKLYLRNHLSDNSYMRDWASHRMLARFGLPHLRARKVRFYINGEKKGFYTLLEAPDQEYVFSRSFPDYDPSNHALFKVKTLSLGCGLYPEDSLDLARESLDDSSKPPYAFERGEHRPITPVLGIEEAENCALLFIDNLLSKEIQDVVLAYVRANEDCGTMLVEEGIIDRDLGGEEWEDVMAKFIDDNLAANVCEPGCTNSNMAQQVDTENFLKNFAVYAVTLNGDSPMGNGNNYYLADAGDGLGWKIVQYDHNNIGGDLLCDPVQCNAHLPDWSIVRPTCRSLESNQLVGPLLTDPVLHSQYIEHVRSFVNDVLGNESFVEEMTQHAAAIKEDVVEDWWSTGGIFFDNEMSPDAVEWNDTNATFLTSQPPFLPLMKARVEAVREQLDAIDAGTFPRSLDEVESWESCVDWRTAEPPETACYQACQYEGCAIPNWALPGVCDEGTGTCLQGTFDPKCTGIEDGGRYEGMEDLEDGRQAFCVSGGGFPSKVFPCPPPPGSPDGDGSPTVAGTSAAAYQSLTLSILTVVWFVYLF